MSGRWMALALVGLPALGGLASAQDEPSREPGTVTREEVRTWTFDRDGREWSVRPAAPTPTGDTGLLRLVGSAYTLPRGEFSFSFFRDNVDRDPKGTDFSVHGFTFAYGVSHRLELFGAVGVENRVKAHYLDEPGGPNEYPFVAEGWDTGFGDVWVGAKYGLMSDYLGDSVGLAIRAVFKIPTADADKGLGTGTATVGGDVLVSKSFGAGEVHAAVGYELSGNPDPPDAAAMPLRDDSTLVGPDFVASALRWGAGVSVPTCRSLQLQAELSGRIYGGTTVDQTNTADLIVGASFWLKPGLFIRPAFVYALGYDGRGRSVSAGRRSGFNLALGYHGGTPCCEIVASRSRPPAPKEEARARFLGRSFARSPGAP